MGSVDVVLANDGRSIHIRPDHVYFAFPSGRLGYDCVSCGAKCCRAQGYEVLVDRELQRQLAAHHALRFFLDPCDGGTGHYHARNFNPACFFLDADSRCSLHVEHGFDAKPETCRLFPFNNLHRAGDFLIVAPHSTLCPLAVLPPGELSDASNHDDLLARMCATGIGTHVRDTIVRGPEVAAAIALERQIVELAERDLHATRYATHGAAQIAVSRRCAGSGEAPDVAQARAAGDVDRFLDLVHEVLGESRRAGDDRDPALVQTMVGMTPAMRARIVFGQGEIPDPADIERLPYLLLVLHTLAALARQAGMAQVTYQTVMGLFDTYRSLVALLADVDRVMAWTADATLDFALSGNRPWQRRYIDVAKALLPAAQRAKRAPLGRILCEHADSSGLDRIVFLKMLARHVHGRLAPLDDRARARWRQRRAAVLQWGLGYFSADFLMMAAERRAGPK